MVHKNTEKSCSVQTTPGQCISEGCLSRHMPPCARNPSTSALSLAELGLAPFWEDDSIFGREGGTGHPASLWLSWEVCFPLAPRSYPAPPSRVSKMRAAPTLTKELRAQARALVEGAPTPVTGTSSSRKSGLWFLGSYTRLKTGGKDWVWTPSSPSVKLRV